MKVVLDTNCFISSIGKRSDFRNVFDAYLDGIFTLCVSTEVLLEYEEKFGQFWGESVTHNLLGLILTSENTTLHSIFFSFNLVTDDPDDNKFADLYLSSGADLLISNDKNLLALNDNKFPILRVIKLEEFSHQLKTN